jgi:hypothetical protein
MASKETIGAIGGESWTPSDSALITRPTRGFQVAVAGAVALEYEDGSTCVWPACAAGVLHPHYGFVRVLDTGTDATGIVVAY